MARSKARRPGGPTKPAEPEAASTFAEREAGAARGGGGDAQPAPAGEAQGGVPPASPAAPTSAGASGAPPPSASGPAAPSRPPAAGSPPRGEAGGGSGGRPPERGPREDGPRGERPSGPPGAAGPPARSSGAFLWGLGGGVIGGILAALAASYLLPPPGDLAVVRSQVSDQAATVEQMRARLEALEGTDAATRERVAALETAADAQPEPDEMARRMAETDARLATLESTVGELGGSDGGERLAALQDELSQLSATVSELRQVGTEGASSDQIADLERRLDQVTEGSERVAALSGKVDALADQVAASEERTGQAATAVATLSGQVKLLDERAEALAAEVSALQGRVASAEERVAAAGDVGGRAAALTLLAGQVAAAIEEGEAYQAPLESLRALGGEDPVVDDAASRLASSAAAGVPTLKQLRESFESTADEIVQSAQAPAGDSVLDRAAGSLMRLVTVRPVGADAEGDDAPARVARAEARLADGDLAGAVAELEGLEGPPTEAAAPWLEQARARLAAQDALDRLHARATDLLAQPR